MIRDVRVHRVDDADVVCHGADVGEQLADLDSRLAVVLELEGRPHERPRLALRLDLVRNRLAVIPVELRLRVEGVDLRHAPVHEKEDDVLGAGLEIGLRQNSPERRTDRARRLHQRRPDHLRERHHPEAGAHGLEGLTPRARLAADEAAAVVVRVVVSVRHTRSLPVRARGAVDQLMKRNSAALKSARLYCTHAFIDARRSASSRAASAVGSEPPSVASSSSATIRFSSSSR